MRQNSGKKLKKHIFLEPEFYNLLNMTISSPARFYHYWAIFYSFKHFRYFHSKGEKFDESHTKKRKNLKKWKNYEKKSDICE